MGVYDVVFRAADYAPVYCWSVKLQVGKPSSVGELPLQAGGSIAASIEVENGRIDPERAVARVTGSSCDGEEAMQRGLERDLIETPVDAEGFVQITGLAAGTYAMEIEQPGYAVVRLPAIRVEAGKESFLAEPVLLRQPRPLEIVVEPAQDPTGMPWRGKLVHPEDGSPRAGTIVYEGEIDRSGTWQIPSHAPGMYQVEIEDGQGNRLVQRTLQLEGEEAVLVEVPSIWVEGSVRFGDQPIAGRLTFRQNEGSKGKSELRAGEDGRFSGSLASGEGTWSLSIESDTPPLSTFHVIRVEPDAEGVARLEIELPSHRVQGVVLGTDGKPAAGAAVMTLNVWPLHRTRADEEGRFELQGLPEASVRIAAEGEHAQISRPVEVAAGERDASDPVKLRLLAARHVSGQVLSATGPVAGVEVTVIARKGQRWGGRAFSGEGGRFALEVPAEPSSVLVVVGGRGFPYQSQALELGSGPILVQMSEVAGTLEVEIPISAAELRERGLRPVLLHQEAEVTQPLLAGRRGQQGGVDGESVRLTASSIAPGEYTVCLMPQAWVGASTEDVEEVAADCDSGYLAEGGTLRLRPDAGDS